jgi:hypothetical protein
MADGKAPFGAGLDLLDPIDDGTSARIDSPPPGPVGLDAKSGTAKQSGATMAEQIVSYARARRGTRVGDGQCFALADRALRAANARSASDYGSITPTADYQWGTSVTLAELQPGDVIQFRDYRYERVVVTQDDRATTTEEHTEERPHHTAIVQSVDGGGAVTVLEQNSPEGSAVARTQLFFTAGTTTSGNRTITIRVQGSVWFYRPQVR